MRALPIGLVLVLISGCPKPSPDVPIDAGLVPAVVDAGPPPPPALERWITIEQLDAGVAQFDFADAGTSELEPITAITLRTNTELTDVRVRLFDWSDAIVASDDEQHSSDAGFEYRLVPLQPLKRGRGYQFVVDAESQDRFRDGAGRDYDEWRLPIRIVGDVEIDPAAPSKKRPKSKKR